VIAPDAATDCGTDVPPEPLHARPVTGFGSCYAQVSRVILESGPGGLRATGVEYRSDDGATLVAQAARKVILSAEAVGSPQILMLSGIGPKSELEAVGVARLADMILVGGANVYPAEIEAALDEHPAVQSCCVIGLPDDDLGNIPYAIVELCGPVSDKDLMAHLRQRLAPHKLPRVIERATGPLRDDAGKVRRSALRAERIAPHPATQRTDQRHRRSRA
jgi:GMC oxidoreductase/AMP-binding enzyme C-terminal domain